MGVKLAVSMQFRKYITFAIDRLNKTKEKLSFKKIKGVNTIIDVYHALILNFLNDWQQYS